jgi:hypothetical protein
VVPRCAVVRELTRFRSMRVPGGAAMTPGEGLHDRVHGDGTVPSGMPAAGQRGDEIVGGALPVYVRPDVMPCLTSCSAGWLAGWSSGSQDEPMGLPIAHPLTRVGLRFSRLSQRYWRRSRSGLVMGWCGGHSLHVHLTSGERELAGCRQVHGELRPHGVRVMASRA